MNGAKPVTGRKAKWLLALASLVLALLATEIGLRAYAILSWQRSIEALYEGSELPPAGRKASLGEMVRPSPSEELVYELKPGLDVIFQGAPVRTNEQGWREQPVEVVAEPGTRRILGIGDSTMFGWGVAEGERYMDILERRLNQRFPEPRWQTVVTAVPGHNLMMEVESLTRYGATLEPDLIVYGWDANDLCLPQFLMERPSFFARSFLLSEYVRGAASELPKLRAKERLQARCHGEGVPERYRPVAGRGPFEAALTELARISTESDTPVVLVGGLGLDFESSMMVVVPPRLLYAPTADRTAAIGKKLVLGRNDPHPNALGHRLLADALFDRLEEVGLWEDLSSMEGQPH